MPVTIANGLPAGVGLVGDWSTVELIDRNIYEMAAFEQGTAQIPTGALDEDGMPVLETVDMVSHNLVRMRAETRVGTAITSTPSSRKLGLTP
ncbi:hypothetical protein [Rathayibacter rathayi]|uniref:hypothetical protein n=1 Tax=Rathayibacter rathayi TaxID=33887 RepID=UPI000CE7C874|nr:hypothetical protein [Rathayibacter rathayi]PPG15034.1 hypothetical protein C5C11_03790 [Rathayibacter rathayi]